MALIRFSGLITGIKGKLQGSIFQGGPYGNIIRSNKNFNKKTSTHWQNVKSIMAELSAGWRELTPAERLGWEAITADYPTTDKYGNPRDPSGYELYIRLNFPCVFNGVGTIGPPAAPAVITDIGAVSVSNGGALNLLAVWTNNQAGDEYIEIFFSPPQSAGKGVQLGKFCWLESNTNAGVTTLDVTASYVARYGALQSGARYWMKLIVTNIVTGQQGVERFESIIMP